MAEVDAVEVEINDRGIGGRLEQLKSQQCPGHRTGRVDDVAEALVVAVRGDQQEQPGLGRQSGIDEQRRVAFAHGGQQHDRIGLQTAGNEREHVRGRPVKPLRILGQDQQRRFGRNLTEQIEDGHRDLEPLRRPFLA